MPWSGPQHQANPHSCIWLHLRTAPALLRAPGCSWQLEIEVGREEPRGHQPSARRGELLGPPGVPRSSGGQEGSRRSCSFGVCCRKTSSSVPLTLLCALGRGEARCCSQQRGLAGCQTAARSCCRHRSKGRQVPAPSGCRAHRAKLPLTYTSCFSRTKPAMVQCHHHAAARPRARGALWGRHRAVPLAPARRCRGPTGSFKEPASG